MTQGGTRTDSFGRRPATGEDGPGGRRGASAVQGDPDGPVVVPTRRRVADLVARHPLVTIFLVAFAARATVATVVAVWRHGHVFDDDLMYSTIASQAAAHQTGGWDAYTTWLFHLDRTFLYPVTAVYAVFGPHPIAAQLLVALMGSLTAVLTARLAAEALPWRWAAVAGLIIALLPSQILWSSLIMKDAFTWTGMAAVALLLAIAARSGARRMWALLGALVVVLALLDHVREHTFLVTCWALVLAAWVGARQTRWLREGAAVAVALVLPLALGLGLAGTHLIHTYAGDPAERRATNAIGANTAVVKPAPTASAAPVPASPPPAASTRSSSTADVVGRNVRYLPRGLSVVLVQPWPWQSGSRSLLPAKAEAVVWWPLLLLAAVGVASVRRHARVLLFPVVLGAGVACMWALVEGNFGTAYRHRGEVAWVVVLLATFGLRTIVQWWRTRQQTAG